MDEATLVVLAAGLVIGALLAATWSLAVRRAPAIFGLMAIATMLAALSGVATLVAMLVRG
jgi:hypothetical protein